jgi:parallel beta-helix repeat protein
VHHRPSGGFGATARRPLQVIIAALFAVTVLLPLAALPAAAAEVTVTPVADSYVESSRPTRNNGARNVVRVDGSPIIDTYLRFNVQGATDFSSAKLRLFYNTSSNSGIQVRPVLDTTWGETTITYANAPDFGAVAGTSPGGTAGTWVEVSISGLVTQNGLISLAVTGPGSTAISIGSRESANDPQLIVGAGVPPPQPPPDGTYTVSRDPGTNTYRAVSSTTSFVGTLKTVVQNAMAQLNGAGGGRINFTAGDFDLGTDQFELDGIANITFAGQGMSATTIRNFTNAAGDTEPFDIVVGTNLVFRDMTVRAGGAFRSTSDALDFDAGNGILVERVAVTESRSKGIIFDGKGAGWTANGNTVRDCVITGIPSDGIELLASSGNTIEGCVITDVGGHGIQATKSSTSAAQPNKKSNDNLIRNNTVTNSGQDGVNINSSDRNQIIGNAIRNSANVTAGRDGIRIGSSDSFTCDDNSVNFNLATDDQAVKTQSWGLNISSALCNRTSVGGANNFDGNRVGAIRDVGTGTIFATPPPDTQPPSKPTGLQAVAISGCQVNLSWAASTDNAGIKEYRIFRGGNLLATVGSSTLAHSDGSTAPGMAYSYTVQAVDTSNIVSTMSDPANLTTPAAACSATFVPIADSWVDASQPTVNFGTSTQLRVDGSPVLTSFLRFNVQAASIGSATLRIFVNSNHSTGFSVHPVSDNTWGETTITANNDPAFGSAVTVSGPLVAGTWVEIDVSSMVTANGQINMALNTTSATAMSLASRQSGANAPQLVVGN